MNTPHHLQIAFIMLVEPVDPLTEADYPASNNSGARFLRRMLEDSALADGHVADAVALAGALNGCVITAFYEQPELAVAAWLAVARREGLQFFAHLARRDSAGTWQPVHPEVLQFDFETVIEKVFIGEQTDPERVMEIIRHARLHPPE